MSRLTAPLPSHLRSSSHPDPHRPPSPPDTDMEAYGTPRRKQAPQPLMMAHPDRPASPGFSETASRSIRRGPSSSLPYTNTGIKDRRRSIKQTRWLVVVIPPPSFTANSPSSPSGGSNNGVLMPLYSTLLSQLSAVARDFALPSTLGVCLYLQISDGNSTFTPRLSDESWQILWSPYLSPSEETHPTLPSHGFPIAGRLEFGIDMAKAKWYKGWVSGSIARSSIDSTLDSTVLESDKAKDEPQVTAEVTPHEDAASETGISAFGRAATTRTGRPGARSVTSSSTAHVPRRLSLLDRRDHSTLTSINAPPRPVHYALETGSTSSSRFTHEETSKPSKTLFPHGLSPIPQQDTPITSAQLQAEVNTLVQKWRDSSASIPKEVLATSPAQPNTPPSATASRNTAAEEEAEPFGAIDLADFSWSVSSQGPPSPLSSSSESPLSSRYARSMHVAERAQGSVILTPSTNTSWGASEWLLPYSPQSNVDRYPSPDIAGRMIEDSPPTPTTATSWGASSYEVSLPRSPRTALLSPDIGARMIEDSPPTPSTATSWGAPLSFPPTPLHYREEYRLPSPDIGQRSFEEGMTRPSPSQPMSRMGWPYFQPGTQEAVTWQHSWPYFQAKSPLPYQYAWPYWSPSDDEKSLPTTLPQPAVIYPHFNLYPAAYPHFDIYPAVDCAVSVTRDISSKALPVALPRTATFFYPHFDLYPAAYPTLEIYPPVKPTLVQDIVSAKALPVSLPRPQASYPDFVLYPPGYPALEIYPVATGRAAVKPDVRQKELPVSLFRPAGGYPDLQLYAPGYPELDIYPDVSSGRRLKNKVEPLAPSVALPGSTLVYPELIIYPSGYPNLVIYPPVDLRKSEVAKPAPIDAQLPRHVGYPTFDLYPPGYPLLEIYPSVKGVNEFVVDPAASKVTAAEVQVHASAYPVLNIYPSVYPWITPYPAISGACSGIATPVKSYRPRKTHQMLHDEWMAKQKPQPSVPASWATPPNVPLPPLPPMPPAAPRGRARSGTVSRRPATPPKPHFDEEATQPAVPHARAALHNLIFDSPIVENVASPIPSSGLMLSAMPLVESPETESTTLRAPIIGLPVSPQQNRTRARGSSISNPSPPAPTGLTRSNTAPRLSYSPSVLARAPKTLGMVAEDEEAPKVLRRSGSMGRMKTNDDFFKQRQSLHNPSKQSSTLSSPDLLSPPASPGRPVSKLDSSKYSFLR